MLLNNEWVNDEIKKEIKIPMLDFSLPCFEAVGGLQSDVLALPIFKEEEFKSSLPPDNENKILPFQYVLCAATSPAVKLHDETLTYLNQGQSYEI